MATQAGPDHVAVHTTVADGITYTGTVVLATANLAHYVGLLVADGYARTHPPRPYVCEGHGRQAGMTQLLNTVHRIAVLSDRIATAGRYPSTFPRPIPSNVIATTGVAA